MTESQEAIPADHISQIDGQEIEFGPHQWARSRNDLHNLVTTLASTLGLTVVATEQSTTMGLAFEDMAVDEEGVVDQEFEDTSMQYLDRAAKIAWQASNAAAMFKHRIQTRDHGTEEQAPMEQQMMQQEAVMGQ